MENKRKDELRLQLVQYLEENYIGERLKPYGARLANLQAVQRSEEVRSPSSVADQEDHDPFADIFKIFAQNEDASTAPDTEEAPRLAPAVALSDLPDVTEEADECYDAPVSFRVSQHQEKRSATHTIRDYLIDQADNETFTEYMLRIIKERDLKEADVYNRVFMDRRHFNRIRNDPEYQPSKRTAMLLAIALHLSLSETQEFIGKAGFAMSHSSKTDLIVEFFMTKGNYNILEINEMLHEFDLPLLLKCE